MAYGVPISSPLPKIGDQAPSFTAQTTQGRISLSDYEGKWVVLFSHPADFTPVCSTEFMAFARKNDHFEKRNAQLIGLSVDSLSSHLAWVTNIKEKMGVEIPFPVIADLNTAVSQKYGMIHPEADETATVRCVFVIDPKQVIRAMIYYPLNVGRSMDEILRLIDGLQTVDQHQVATPADWRPGEDVVEPAPTDVEGVHQRLGEDLSGTDWYLKKKRI